MNYTSENLCVCFLCFMLGYLFCQNMRGTEGVSPYKEWHGCQPNDPHCIPGA